MYSDTMICCRLVFFNRIQTVLTYESRLTRGDNLFNQGSTPLQRY